ncbi:MAG: glycerol-3-phosphate dehydrogenase [Verrucomicrobiota bacterium]|nr:glycerol-3-phosphate dehydrogenase [Verrucomicrobiota bacterium]
MRETATRNVQGTLAAIEKVLKEKKMYDDVIIGAGVVGSAIAGELSKDQLKILLAEKSYGVSNGATKANEGAGGGNPEDWIEPHRRLNLELLREYKKLKPVQVA